ncbi:ABC transporter ATP-binding protein [Antrihabitans cavernicola]|uniref:ABC transporter ATP-binding protein n=1 Tax=Antrihabitans cavernicola TaxID=2495913 RepID=A0A5A7S9B5_9NOCA|nr:ABC transporter ATP-binding protein [Spelaeibacter cavernicola]KAA0021497.1 ABC transporter ATP-binding protein [Spelaeibacter cavernicola]
MSSSAMPAVEVDHLVKTYSGGRKQPDVRALDDLSFAIPAGTVYGLLGPNGAGKSTTTKICTTLSAATSGSARVSGFDVRGDADAVRQHIGYVSQGTAADPRQTPMENLMMSARLRGISRPDATDRSKALLAQFDLSEAADRKVSKLSGGMRRKLDVALGLVHSPSVLFLDEPTTGLDPEARAEMWAEIRRLAAEKALTVVLTTHYLEEADELADRLVIIDHGRSVIEGTPSELKATLDGDTLSVELLEPDVAAVRRAAESIPALRHVVVEARGTSGRLFARADDPAAIIGRVISAFDSAGIEFGAVSVSRPSLDDVYLHYAGRAYQIDAGTVDNTDKVSA